MPRNPYSTGRKPWTSEPWRSEGQDSPNDKGAIKLKIFYFALLIVVVFGILTLRLARMQLVNGEKYRLRADTNRLREVPIIQARGLVTTATALRWSRTRGPSQLPSLRPTCRKKKRPTSR